METEEVLEYRMSRKWAEVLSNIIMDSNPKHFDGWSDQEIDRFFELICCGVIVHHVPVIPDSELIVTISEAD
jgi:hypothetical protein